MRLLRPLQSILAANNYDNRRMEQSAISCPSNTGLESRCSHLVNFTKLAKNGNRQEVTPLVNTSQNCDAQKCVAAESHKDTDTLLDCDNARYSLEVSSRAHRLMHALVGNRDGQHPNVSNRSVKIPMFQGSRTHIPKSHTAAIRERLQATLNRRMHTLNGNPAPKKSTAKKILKAEKKVEKQIAKIAPKIAKATKTQGNSQRKKKFQVNGHLVVGGHGDYSIKKFANDVGDWADRNISSFFQKIFGPGDTFKAQGTDVQHNTLLDTGDYVPTFSNMEGKFKYTNFKFHEMVKMVHMSTTFAKQVFRIDVSNENTFPWLSRIAQNYQRYRVKGFVVTLKSLSSKTVVAPTQSLGQVVLVPFYDVNAVIPNDIQALLNSESAISTDPASNAFMAAECDFRASQLNSLKIRAPGQTVNDDEEQFYALGDFVLATQGAPNAYDDAMEMWVTYDIDLFSERLVDTPKGLAYMGDCGNSLTLPLTLIPPTLAVPQPRVNTIGCTIAANKTDLVFPTTIKEGRMYQICYVMKYDAVQSQPRTIIFSAGGGMSLRNVLLNQSQSQVGCPENVYASPQFWSNSIAFVKYTTPVFGSQPYVRLAFGSGSLADAAKATITVVEVPNAFYTGLTDTMVPVYTRERFYKYLTELTLSLELPSDPPPFPARLIEWTSFFTSDNEFYENSNLVRLPHTNDYTIEQARSAIIPFLSRRDVTSCKVLEVEAKRAHAEMHAMHGNIQRIVGVDDMEIQWTEEATAFQEEMDYEQPEEESDSDEGDEGDGNPDEYIEVAIIHPGEPGYVEDVRVAQALRYQNAHNWVHPGVAPQRTWFRQYAINPMHRRELYIIRALNDDGDDEGWSLAVIRRTICTCMTGERCNHNDYMECPAYRFIDHDFVDEHDFVVIRPHDVDDRRPPTSERDRGGRTAEEQAAANARMHAQNGNIKFCDCTNTSCARPTHYHKMQKPGKDKPKPGAELRIAKKKGEENKNGEEAKFMLCSRESEPTSVADCKYPNHSHPCKENGKIDMAAEELGVAMLKEHWSGGAANLKKKIDALKQEVGLVEKIAQGEHQQDAEEKVMQFERGEDQELGIKNYMVGLANSQRRIGGETVDVSFCGVNQIDILKRIMSEGCRPPPINSVPPPVVKKASKPEPTPEKKLDFLDVAENFGSTAAFLEGKREKGGDEKYAIGDSVVQSVAPAKLPVLQPPPPFVPPVIVPPPPLVQLRPLPPPAPRPPPPLAPHPVVAPPLPAPRPPPPRVIPHPPAGPPPHRNPPLVVNVPIMPPPGRPIVHARPVAEPQANLNLPAQAERVAREFTYATEEVLVHYSYDETRNTLGGWMKKQLLRVVPEYFKGEVIATNDNQPGVIKVKNTRHEGLSRSGKARTGKPSGKTEQRIAIPKEFTTHKQVRIFSEIVAKLDDTSETVVADLHSRKLLSPGAKGALNLQTTLFQAVQTVLFGFNKPEWNHYLFKLHDNVVFENTLLYFAQYLMFKALDVCAAMGNKVTPVFRVKGQQGDSQTMLARASTGQ